MLEVWRVGGEVEVGGRQGGLGFVKGRLEVVGGERVRLEFRV